MDNGPCHYCGEEDSACLASLLSEKEECCSTCYHPSATRKKEQPVMKFKFKDFFKSEECKACQCPDFICYSWQESPREETCCDNCSHDKRERRSA